MELIEFLLMPEAVVGCIIGLLVAGLVHWFAPKPEPVVLEAGVVALGFVCGLFVSWLSAKKHDKERPLK
jgi:hypothetical protein